MSFNLSDSSMEYFKDMTGLIDRRIALFVCLKEVNNKKEILNMLGFSEEFINYNNIIEYKLYLKDKIKTILDKNICNPFIHLLINFNFNEFEEHCLILSLMYCYDIKYREIVSFFQFGNSEYLYVQTAVQFFSGEYNIENKFDLILQMYERLENFIFEKSNSFPFQILLPKKQIISFIFTEKIVFNKDYTIFFPDEKLHDILYNHELNNNILKAVEYDGYSNKIICFFGEEGSGRKFHIKHVSKKINKPIVFFEALYKNIEEFYGAFTEAMINKAMLCILNFDILEESQIKSVLNIYEQIGGLFPLILIGKSQKIINIQQTYNYYEFFIPQISDEERLLLWYKEFKNANILFEIDVYELSNKFLFSPKKIEMVVQKLINALKFQNNEKNTRDLLYEICRSQNVLNFSKRAVKIEPLYDWNDIILDIACKGILFEACNHIKYSDIVYNKWGFKSSYGKGTSILFEGPSGTGKTMAAQVISKELELELYKIDLSQVVSKYIGETEKILYEIFKEGSENNIILFFDETDALFGKRSEVKNSHDKYANIETAFILQKLEEYEGMIIMATNYIENIDSAFIRRINYIVHFSLPDKNSRIQIWKNIFPEKMPKNADIDYKYLGEQFEISGGNIKNSALSAAFSSAAENKPLEMRHIIKAVIHEMTKQGKVILKEDLGEYFYILEGQ